MDRNAINVTLTSSCKEVVLTQLMLSQVLFTSHDAADAADAASALPADAFASAASVPLLPGLGPLLPSELAGVAAAKAALATRVPAASIPMVPGLGPLLPLGLAADAGVLRGALLRVSPPAVQATALWAPPPPASWSKLPPEHTSSGSGVAADAGIHTDAKPANMEHFWIRFIGPALRLTPA